MVAQTCSLDRCLHKQIGWLLVKTTMMRIFGTFPKSNFAYYEHGNWSISKTIVGPMELPNQCLLLFWVHSSLGEWELENGEVPIFGHLLPDSLIILLLSFIFILKHRKTYQIISTKSITDCYCQVGLRDSAFWLSWFLVDTLLISCTSLITSILVKFVLFSVLPPLPSNFKKRSKLQLQLF